MATFPAKANWSQIGAPYYGFAQSDTTPTEVAYDVQQDPNIPKAGSADVRGQYVDLIKKTTDAYNIMMQNGRDNDAYALKDAMERYARIGSQLGLNSWSRKQATDDLRARLAAAARTLQGTLTSQALDAHAKLLGNIGNIDAQTFAQQMEIGKLQLAQNQKPQDLSKALSPQAAAAAAQASAAATKAANQAKTSAFTQTQQPAAAPTTAATGFGNAAKPVVEPSLANSNNLRVISPTGKWAFGSNASGAPVAGVGPAIGSSEWFKKNW